MVDVVSVQALDDGRRYDGREAGNLSCRYAALAKVVQPESPDLAVGIDGEAVMRSRKDLGRFVFGHAYALRDQGFEAATLQDASSQLVLLPRAPRKDVAVVGQSEDVVCATGQLNDVFEARDAHR
ncbi:uncharacterized protein ColSpa_12501 [Colletotrichum spaethianum]|uniref:Uncharacterized protein n=1 Tax=Colletotrichum spaethianum TaxID=700344 RepID=A0AA37UQE0_9PEZI|nr:uncharacterized protein ColSpa_12501 [Colletotrichum spaethianum]GKT52320.1 hypothetical protein ColSpa_12501 [Colletotrichum spaethianum]